VPRTDGIRLPIELRNPTGRTVWVRAMSQPTLSDAPADFSGPGGPDAPSPLAVGPFEVWSLTLAVQAGRAVSGAKHIPVTLYASDTPGGELSAVDRAVAVVNVGSVAEGPPAAGDGPRVDVRVVGRRPEAGAAIVRIENRGEPLPDLTVSVDGEAADRVSVSPAVRSMMLDRGGRLDLLVAPRTTAAGTDPPAPASCSLSIEAGGKRKEAVVEFPLAGRRPLVTRGREWTAAETLCRLPLGAGTAAVTVDGPGREAIFPSAPPGAAGLAGLGVAPAAPRRVLSVADLPARPPAGEAAALALPPPAPPAPPVAGAASTGPQSFPSETPVAKTPPPTPAAPRTPEEREKAVRQARHASLAALAARTSSWWGGPVPPAAAAAVSAGLPKAGDEGSPAVKFSAEGTPAVWVDPQVTFVLRAETADEPTGAARRTLRFASLNAPTGRIVRPSLALADPAPPAADMPSLRLVRDPSVEDGATAAAWVSGGRAAVRLSPDLGATWSPPLEPFADRGPVRAVELAVLGDGAVGGQAEPRALVAGLVGEPGRGRLMLAVVPNGVSRDLGEAESCAVFARHPDAAGAGGGRFEVVVQVGRGADAVLRVWRFDRAGRSVDAPLELGPGRDPTAAARADGSAVMHHRTGPDGAPRLVRRQSGPNGDWGTPNPVDGGRTDWTATATAFLNGEAGVALETPPPMDAPTAGPRMTAFWAAADGVPVRMAPPTVAVSAAVLALDFDGRGELLGRPHPADGGRERSERTDAQTLPVAVRVNGRFAGTLRVASDGFGTYLLPLDPAALRTGGPGLGAGAGVHRVEVWAGGAASPGRALTLCGVRMAVRGEGLRRVWASTQAEADAQPVGPSLTNSAPHRLLWTGNLPAAGTSAEPSAAVRPGLRRVLLSRDGSPATGRVPIALEPGKPIELPSEVGGSVLLSVPRSESAAGTPWVFGPAEEAAGFSVTPLDPHTGEPLPPDTGLSERSFLLAVRRVAAGSPATLRLR
jgi:hypothetical protein